MIQELTLGGLVNIASRLPLAVFEPLIFELLVDELTLRPCCNGRKLLIR